MWFFQPGHGEDIKGACHELARGLCAVMAIYNAAAFVVRKDGPRKHLAFNTLLYGVGWWYESRQVARHRKAR